MQIATPDGPQDVVVDEVRQLIRPAAERFAAYMRENRLTLCPFVLKSDGRLGVDDGPAVIMALHAELLEKAGLTVVNHAVWFEQGPSSSDPKNIVEKTCFSLLCRASLIQRLS